jgi:hypothetical protein
MYTSQKCAEAHHDGDSTPVSTVAELGQKSFAHIESAELLVKVPVVSEKNGHDFQTWDSGIVPIGLGAIQK